jgi:hypothetical protein
MHYGNCDVYREGLNFFATVAALYADIYMHHYACQYRGFAGREPPLSAQEVNNLLTKNVAISIARGGYRSDNRGMARN